jgi:hypothetical protein
MKLKTTPAKAVFPPTYKPIVTVNKAKRLVVWNATPPPYLHEMTHKFSIINAIEEASRLLRTDFTRQRETITVGAEARCVVVTLPQTILDRGSNGLLRKVNGKALVGELGNRRIFYTRAQRMEHKMFVSNGARQVTILVQHKPSANC